MRKNRGQLFLGGILVLVGLALLLGKMLHINLWGILWPLALIALGIWLAMRPQLVAEGTVVHQRLFGDIKRSGVWEVRDEEVWMFAGDISLDMAEAEFPLGETRIRCSGFAGDVKLRMPEEVGVMVAANSFAGEVKLFGEKQGGLLAPIRMTSDNYDTAESKINLETHYFAADIKIVRAES